jgi:hypothetical protein
LAGVECTLLDLISRVVQDQQMSEVLIDFIAFDKARDACLMVLVEEAWNGTTEDHLRALQDRMFGCLEAALDGQLAEQFPEAAGKMIVVRIDCYDVPQSDVDEFVSRFAAGVSELPDYAAEHSPHIAGYSFEVNHEALAGDRGMSA